MGSWRRDWEELYVGESWARDAPVISQSDSIFFSVCLRMGGMISCDCVLPALLRAACRRDDWLVGTQQSISPWMSIDGGALAWA